MGSGISKHEGDAALNAGGGDVGRKVGAAQQSTPSPPSPLAASVASASSDASNSAKEDDVEGGGGGGGCPMKRKDGSYSFDWSALFRKEFPHGPRGKMPISEEEAKAKTMTAPAATEVDNEIGGGGGCPVKHRLPGQNPQQFQEFNVYSQPIDPKNNMPQVANQLPSSAQSKPLSTERVVSNIPKGGVAASAVEEESSKKTWVYPSAQMFWNALSRKGKLGDTSEDDMENVVAMHNNMNEKTWRKVLEWEEAVAPGRDPTLLKFQGRPTDLSPKAAFKHYALGHPLPFDRHDWTVLRNDGTTVRYVIDYYYDEARASDEASSAMPKLEDTDATPSLLVDVRPALDGVSHAYYRAVAMPFARNIVQSTKFQPLPMRPTSAMQSQVLESVQVWQTIQASASGRGAVEEGNADASASAPIDEDEARDLASKFAQIRDSCRAAEAKVNSCDSEVDCSRAAMDLTMCMGKVACPLQHQTLVSALTSSSSDDATIEAAITSVSECVALKSSRKAQAQEQYPKLFK